LEFKRVSKILAERRTETTGDFSILGVYAEVYSRWVSAKRTLADQGLEIECTLLDSNGQAHVNRKLNPMLKVVESCETKLLSLLKSLGLTPNSRETVKPAREKPRKTRGIVDL
jgi:P27 family predicted phage terminase small subunit